MRYWSQWPRLLLLLLADNEIDGEPNAQSRYLLTDVPRNQIDGNGPTGQPWDGFVSSDFGAINKLQTGHKVVPNSSMAISQYINAGGSVQGFEVIRPLAEELKARGQRRHESHDAVAQQLQAHPSSC